MLPDEETHLPTFITADNSPINSLIQYFWGTEEMATKFTLVLTPRRYKLEGQFTFPPYCLNPWHAFASHLFTDSA